ncbi:MAG: DUF4402 domain-containing protein, partial [Sphingomicrobium sp.]
MLWRRSWWIRAGCALVLSAVSPCLEAAPPTALGSGSANVIRPVTVVKLKDMVFGALSRTAAGTAVLEPNADVLTTTGGVTAIGGGPHSAEFEGASQSSSVVIIKVPNKPS